MHKHILDDLGARVRDRRAQDSPSVDETPLEPADDPFVRELMAPLPPERAAAILDHVLGPPTAGADSATVLPFALPRPAKSRRLILAVSLTMAAAAVLVVMRIDRMTPPERVAIRDVLDADAYELSLLDAPGVARGADSAPLSFTTGDPVVLRLRPRDPVRGRIEANVRAVQGPRELDLTWRASARGDQGHLEIVGTADDLLTTSAGVWELEVTLRHDNTSAPLWRGRTRLLLAPDRPERP